ncbi:MAG: 50S ribosomal protein L4 [Nevskiales bacterium]
MKLNVHNEKTGVTVDKELFGAEFNGPLVHQVVTAYMAGGRAGTKAQKTRAEVRGGGRKPWKQKGTGNARAGTIRSPLWRGGGIIFAAKPRSFEQKVNRKMYRGALASILSELNRLERLIVVKDFEVKQPKTKLLLSELASLKVEDVLLVTHEDNQNLSLAARNLPGVDVCGVDDVDPVALVAREKIVITVGALKRLQEKLA